MNSYYNILPVSADTCKILLYGLVSSYKEDVNSRGFATEFAEAERQYDNIDVRINSAGGDVFEGIAIFNTLRASQKNVTIYIDGVAASIAGIIALCGKSVKMNRHAMMMLHRVSGGSYGDADKMKRAAGDMEKVESVLVNILAERMGIENDKVMSTYMDGQDHWLTATEALELGLVNEIYDGAKVSLPKGQIKNKALEIYNQFSNILTPKQMKILWNKLGLKNEAGEDEALKAVEQLQAELQTERTNSDSQKQEIESLKARIKTFEDQVKAERVQQIDTILTNAVKSGRIQEAQKPTFKAILENDFDNGKAAIESITPQQRMIDMLNKSPQGERKDWSFTDYQRKDPKALATMKAETPDVFKALYKNEFGTDINI
jgi:ATP-dependent Clp endopeptidase proteolytic subunit ClpP